ncbi:MAG: hypothetical protein WBA46_04615 [Thermomicrobiales bacterium]
MAPIDGVIAALKAEPAIAAVCGARVFDRDIRQDGEVAVPEAFDPVDHTVLSSLVVLDGGEMRNPFGAAIGIGMLHILVIAPGTAVGWDGVPALGGEVIRTLEGWQDGVAGATLRFANRLGRRRIDGEARDRLTFQVSSVLPTMRW